MKIIKSAVFAFLLGLVGLTASGFWASFQIPQLIYEVESRLGHTVSYETHLRLYLSAIFLILIFSYGCYSWFRKSRPHLLISSLLLTAFLLLLAVFAGDRRHSLIEEFSWIRYPSAFGLVAAGLIFFLISRFFNQGERWPKRAELIWLILSAGFVFAGVDEVAEIHEKIGYVLEKLFSLSHVTTDLVTIVYFFAGLAVLVFILPTILKTIREHSALFGKICLFALLLFGLACFFDTFDQIILNYLRSFTDGLTERGYFFSDRWQIIYEPKKFLNGLEEIFEYFAGVLFLGAGLILLKDLLKTKCQSLPIAINEIDKKPNKITLVLIVLFLLGLVSPFFLFRTTGGSSPLENDGQVELIASVRDGLFHSDDLAYSDQWGIVLANESHPGRRGQKTGPAVFRWANGKLEKLLDPGKALVDADSVAADSQAIYVSDGAQGKLFRWQNEKAGFEEIASRKDGLKTPEALTAENGKITFLDEGEKSASQRTADGKIAKDFLRHPFFLAPEGIAYHPGLKAFLITDDKSGAIFKYNFRQEPEIWVKPGLLEAPEDLAVSSDGDVYVTDNGRGEIIIFSQDGKIKKIIRFRPLFRDLQGIALDNEGNIFVVSADSFGYASFMPSYLWKIKKL